MTATSRVGKEGPPQISVAEQPCGRPFWAGHKDLRSPEWRDYQPSAELPRTTQERLFSQPQPSPSGSDELLAQYG